MTRRVGTFTLGISMLVIGIIIPLALLYPDNAMKLIQLSPLLLVGLGIEILFYAITFKSDGVQKLRYDGLSIFLVIAITSVTICASLIVPFAKNFITMNKETMKIRDEISESIYDNMAKYNYSGEVNVYNSNDIHYWITDDIKDYEYNVNIYFNELQDITEDEIATMMYNTIKDIDERTSYVYVDLRTKDGVYSIRSGRSALKSITEQNVHSRMNFRKEQEYPRNGTYNDNGNYTNSEVSSAESSSNEMSSDENSSNEISSDENSSNENGPNKNSSDENSSSL